MTQTKASRTFAGAGAGAQEMSQQSGTIMQDFLAQEAEAKSSLFKGVRGEREKWMTEAGGALSALQRLEGTEDLEQAGVSGTPSQTVTPPAGDPGPPGWPSGTAFAQWQTDGSDPNNMVAYGYQEPAGGTGGTSGYGCFVKGTKIIMWNGNEKNIEDVVAGDFIASFDESNDSYSIGIVTESLIHPINMVIDTAVVGDKLKGSLDHPIYINGKWAEICESEADFESVTEYIDNYYNLEIDGFAVFGSFHNYIADGYIVSGLGDNEVLNDIFQRTTDETYNKYREYKGV
jgi:hypothetical protein